MKKYKALRTGFDGVQLREAGDVFMFGGQVSDWMEEVSDEFFKKESEAKRKQDMHRDTPIPYSQAEDLMAVVKPKKAAKEEPKSEAKKAETLAKTAQADVKTPVAPKAESESPVKLEDKAAVDKKTEPKAEHKADHKADVKAEHKAEAKKEESEKSHGKTHTDKK